MKERTYVVQTHPGRTGVLKRHWHATFLYQHGHKKVASFFAPPSLSIFHPSFCLLFSAGLQHLPFWTLASDLGCYVYMQQLQQMPLQSSQNQAPGQNQLRWTPIHISSAGKNLTFLFLALEKFLRNTPVCAATILLVRASHFLPLAFSAQSIVNKKPVPSLSAAASFALSCQAWIHSVAAVSVAQGKGKNSPQYLQCQDSRGILACQWHGTFYEAISWVTS